MRAFLSIIGIKLDTVFICCVPLLVSSRWVPRFLEKDLVQLVQQTNIFTHFLFVSVGASACQSLIIPPLPHQPRTLDHSENLYRYITRLLHFSKTLNNNNSTTSSNVYRESSRHETRNKTHVKGLTSGFPAVYISHIHLCY